LNAVQLFEPHFNKTNLPALMLLQFNVGLGMPITLEAQSLTMGILMRWIYPLPTDPAIFIDPSNTVQKRSTPLSTRWDTYLRLEAIIDRYELRQVARLQ
jgi:hypothetical protein